MGFQLMVGFTTASRINLRQWSIAKAPDLKDFVDAMVEMTSCECVCVRAVD